jgi:hypothetical protein
MLEASDDESAEPDWELLDCFSGGGTLSLAARDAGMRVGVAVDNSADALRVYKENFRDTRVHCATLGPGHDEFTFPAPRERLHCHLSPPCVELSNAKTNGRTADGLAMLEWSVRQGVKYRSWSVETVYTSATRTLAQKMATELPDRVAFGVYDGVNFGAPQNRVRLVLSTPKIIKRLNEAPACGRVSMDDAFRTAGIVLPSGATHVKNSSPLKEGTALRPLTGPAFTCCASRALSFCDATAATVLSMRPEHTRALMGLPNSFKLSGVQRIDQRVLGNGLCYGLARALCLAAQGLEITPLFQTPSTLQPKVTTSRPSRKRTRGEDSDGDTATHCMCKELEARVIRLEHRLLKLQKQLRRSQS